jgi:hypothetical protein
VLLVWIYYAALIVLLGAEYTQAWVKQRGRRIEPEEGAVRVVERWERVGESTSPVLPDDCTSSSTRTLLATGSSPTRVRRQGRIVSTERVPRKLM